MLKFIGIIVAITGITLLKGWILSVLWMWFIVPLLSAPVLPVLYGVGLMLIVDFLTPSKINTNMTEEMLITSYVFTVVLSFISLGLGWIVVQFM